MPHLFEPLEILGVRLPNRIAVSPMCQYSCQDGLANDWHFVHLGSRAVGGAGLVFTEATAVTAGGHLAEAEGGWRHVVAPSAVPFAEGHPALRELHEREIGEFVRTYGDAARRALQA